MGLQLLWHQRTQNNTNTDQTYIVEAPITLNVTNKTLNKETNILSQGKMTNTGLDTLDH